MKTSFDPELLDQAIDAALQAILGGKEQVFAIAENARNERLSLEVESITTRREVEQVIVEVDRLELEYRKARQRLMHVSREFSPSSEAMIKDAYDKTHSLQIELLLAREKEARLKLRRDEIARRLRAIEDMIGRADMLMTKLTTVVSYLSGGLKQVGNVLKNAEQRQQVGAQIIRMQEEERRRVAREIHDGPAQMMANVLLRTELCERMLDHNIDQVRAELGDIKHAVRESLSEVRGIISNLRPMALDDLGLIPALRKYFAGLQERQAIPIDFRLIGGEKRLESSVEVTLFRIIQECLTNAIKHAKASSIRVRIELMTDSVSLSVEDDGIGFIPEEKTLPDGERFGLLGMQERLALFGGKLKIKSNPGEGTKIHVLLPLKSREENEG